MSPLNGGYKAICQLQIYVKVICSLLVDTWLIIDGLYATVAQIQISTIVNHCCICRGLLVDWGKPC